MEIDKNLESKILKLYNMQQGAKEVGNVEEAANAAAKLQDMLIKYQLDLADLLKKGEVAKITVEEAYVDVAGKTKKNEGNWVEELYCKVAKANMCIPLLSRKTGKVVLVGTEVNRDMTMYICEQLMPKLRNLCKADWKKYEGHEKVNAFTRAYLRAAAIEIGQRLKENIEKAQSNNEAINSLVLVTGKEVNDFLADKYPRLGYAKSIGNYKARGGAALGIQAGRSVEINKGVGLWG